VETEEDEIGAVSDGEAVLSAGNGAGARWIDRSHAHRIG